MNADEVYAELLETIEVLKEASLESPVIVEGERDVRSLRALGVAGEIISLNAGVPIFQLAESVGRRHPTVILLTDWDHRGGQLCRLLRDAFEANQVRYDDQLRARLTILCRKDIKDVESLAAHVERLSRKAEAGWQGKDSRKSRAVRDRRARRIARAGDRENR